MVASLLLFLGLNLAGMYTRFLTDRSQRGAYLETRRAIATALHAQQENDKQEKLLLSSEWQPLECSLCQEGENA